MSQLPSAGEEVHRGSSYEPGRVLARPTGEALRFTCADHLPAWASRIRGRYVVLERDEWEARGRGYRGPMLGGED